MRRILFRGKGTYSGEWVKGDLNYYHSGSGVFIAKRKNKGDFCVRVIPETVGQYTGLHDKNGKKIFEGDILKIDGRIYYVKFHNGTFGVVVKNGGYAGSIPKVASFVQGFIEIIGNIHDNPELLGGANIV